MTFRRQIRMTRIEKRFGDESATLGKLPLEVIPRETDPNNTVTLLAEPLLENPRKILLSIEKISFHCLEIDASSHAKCAKLQPL